jgi:hypothetical protein
VRTDRPTPAEEFRKEQRTELVTGPIHGFTVRIRGISAADFIDLGILPGIVGGEDGAEQKKKVDGIIRKDRALQERVVERVLTSGIVEPKVVRTDAEIEDKATTISIRELGGDAGWYAEKILKLSGVGEGPRIGPFRRAWLRLVGRRDREAVRSAAERITQGEPA